MRRLRVGAINSLMRSLAFFILEHRRVYLPFMQRALDPSRSFTPIETILVVRTRQYGGAKMHGRSRDELICRQVTKCRSWDAVDDSGLTSCPTPSQILFEIGVTLVAALSIAFIGGVLSASWGGKCLPSSAVDFVGMASFSPWGHVRPRSGERLRSCELLAPSASEGGSQPN